jgi:hypothetical protein
MKLRFLRTISLLAIAGGFLFSASAAEMIFGNVRVIKVEGGSVQLLDSAGKASPLAEGTFLRQGSKIRTDDKGTAVLLFENGSSVNIKPASEFSIDKFVQDPFDSEGVDYQNLKNEPSKSVTRLSVPEGTIIVDVAKLKKSSTYEISTPVGVAGIRGTSLFVQSRRANPAQPVALGVAKGLVSFRTPGGASRAIAGGQSFGVGGRANGFSFTSNPAGGGALLAQTREVARQMQRGVPPVPFRGAPAPAPAPPEAGGNLSAEQQQTIKEAADKGPEALVEAVEKLAAESPEAAPEIAAAAADADPVAAPEVAAAAAKAAPDAAVAVAGAVAQVAPQQANAIAQAVVAAVPSANPAAIQAATQAGAQQGSQQPAAGSNQPLNTGDQGTTTAGQSLPGSTGGSGTGGSGTAPRPTPSSN